MTKAEVVEPGYVKGIVWSGRGPRRSGVPLPSTSSAVM